MHTNVSKFWVPASAGTNGIKRQFKLISSRSVESLGHKRPHSLDRARAEILVASAGDAEKAFGAFDQRVEPLARLDRNDGVAIAMHDQHRHFDVADTQVRAELVLHQETHRHEWIDR